MESRSTRRRKTTERIDLGPSDVVRRVAYLGSMTSALSTPSRIASLLAVLAAAFGLSACGDTSTHRDWAAMDCNFAATLHGKGRVPAEEALDSIQKLSKDLETLLSDYDSSGPLSVLRGRSGDTVSPDPRIVGILRKTIPVVAASRGTLDIGVHEIKALWNLDSPDPRVPDSSAIDSLLRRRHGRAAPVPDSVLVRPPFEVLADGRVVLLVDSLPIDLGGVAKGWAVDRMSELLVRLGYPVHLIQGGGEIVSRGRKSSGKWRIGIKNPRETSTVAALVELDSGMAISTSGDYERFFLLDGIRYHHLIDPATGRPSRNGVASASLLCPTSAQCDRWSKPMFLLGPGRGTALADSLGIPVLWILDTPRGICGEATASWGARLVRDTLPPCPR